MWQNSNSWRFWKSTHRTSICDVTTLNNRTGMTIAGTKTEPRHSLNSNSQLMNRPSIYEMMCVDLKRLSKTSADSDVWIAWLHFPKSIRKSKSESDSWAGTSTMSQLWSAKLPTTSTSRFRTKILSFFSRSCRCRTPTTCPITVTMTTEKVLLIVVWAKAKLDPKAIVDL